MSTNKNIDPANSVFTYRYLHLTHKFLERYSQEVFFFCRPLSF